MFVHPSLIIPQQKGITIPCSSAHPPKLRQNELRRTFHMDFFVRVLCAEKLPADLGTQLRS